MRRTIALFTTTLVAIGAAMGLGTLPPASGEGVGTAFDDALGGARRGEPQPRIHNGTDVANPGWVASIAAGGAYTCTGTLVASAWVLTAAHCVDGRSGYAVRVGAATWDGGQARSVVEVRIHPDWSGDFVMDTDLALVRFVPATVALPLPRLAASATWPVLDQALLVTGWGLTEPSSGPATHLQGAEVFVTSDLAGTVDTDYCLSDFVTPSGYDAFCFGGPIGSWSCSGDSGGPLVGYRTPASTSGPVDMVYGVVSFGFDSPCDEWVWDDVAQPIGPHHAWITEVIGQRFIDVGPDHLFATDIEWLAEEGITRGCNPPTNDRFCPEDPVTRAQMAAFFTRALGLTDVDPAATFTDVPPDDLFATDIARLATAGITRGCNPPDNTRYCPDRSVTRAEMAAFMVRALDLTDVDPAATFTDVPPDHLFATDIARLATAGITRGCNPPDNTRYCPDAQVTRGQMAAFFRRAPLP